MPTCQGRSGIRRSKCGMLLDLFYPTASPAHFHTVSQWGSSWTFQEYPRVLQLTPTPGEAWVAMPRGMPISRGRSGIKRFFSVKGPAIFPLSSVKKGLWLLNEWARRWPWDLDAQSRRMRNGRQNKPRKIRISQLVSYSISSNALFDVHASTLELPQSLISYKHSPPNPKRSSSPNVIYLKNLPFK